MAGSTAAVRAVLPNFEALSEFWSYHADCGQDAFMVIEHTLYGTPALTGPDLDAWCNDMATHGYGPAGGATTMSALVSYASTVRKIAVVEANPWGSSAESIHQTLLAHAGRDGIVLEVSAAHNLTGNEAGVNSHYVALGGIDPELGYLVANGDDVMALNVNHGHGKVIACRWMSWDVIASAQPSACAVFPNPRGGTTMALPANWKDDGTTMTAPNGNAVVRGFRSWILAHEWDAVDVPLENEHGTADGAHVRQLFRDSGLIWDTAGGVRRDDIGQQLADARAALAAAQKTPPAPTTGLTAAQQAAITAAITAAQAAAAQATSDATAAQQIADALTKAFPR